MEDANKAYMQTLEEMRTAEPEILEHKKISEGMARLANERVNELLRTNAEPVKEDRYKEPFVYYEPAEGTGDVPAAICTCGWRKPHYRFKVLQKAAIKHAEKTGHKIS
jgi:hypothetical protein